MEDQNIFKPNRVVRKKKLLGIHGYPRKGDDETVNHGGSTENEKQKTDLKDMQEVELTRCAD